MIHRQANEGDGKMSLVDTVCLPYSQCCCDLMSWHMNHLQEYPVPCETSYYKSRHFVCTTTNACYIKMNKMSGLNSEPARATGEKEIKISLENGGRSLGKQNTHLFELPSLLFPTLQAEDCSSLNLELSKLLTNQHLCVQWWAITTLPLPQSRSPHSWGCMSKVVLAFLPFQLLVCPCPHTVSRSSPIKLWQNEKLNLGATR